MNSRAVLMSGLLLVLAATALGGEIHVAAEKGDLRRVEALLAADPSLMHQEGHDYTTPLHWASARGHKAIAELLISRKANLEAKDKYGFTPLITAAQNGQSNVVDLLLRNRAAIDASEKSGKTSLHWAAIFNHKTTVEVLLANKADVNARDRHNETPLGKAMQNGHGEVAIVLRRFGAKQ